MKKNVLYAQSGGVTSVINASAQGVIDVVLDHPDNFNELYAASNGVIGILQEELINIRSESSDIVKRLSDMPGGAFGSCRYKLKSNAEDTAEYDRILEVLDAYDIGYFFYNGGGDSQDTTFKLSKYAESKGYPLVCIGIPKTIDNDLPYTDNSPGFGSVAKYVAVSTQEITLDLMSMKSSSTKVFILEVMGRHAGWIAASSTLAGLHDERLTPQFILLPEVPFESETFLSQLQSKVNQLGHAVIVVSEGIKENGVFLTQQRDKDSFGHAQLGGVASILSNLVTTELGYKNHWAISDYLQRSARHIASKVDIDQAYQVGQYAVKLAIEGHNAMMPIIVRTSDEPYEWHISAVEVANVANIEKKLPAEYINEDKISISSKGKAYLSPLIQGESYPSYELGVPKYQLLNKALMSKKLTDFII